MPLLTPLHLAMYSLLLQASLSLNAKIFLPNLTTVHAAQTSKKLAALSITRSKGKVAMGMVSEIPKSRTISILDMDDLQHLHQLMSH